MRLSKYLVAFSCLLASCSGIDEMKETASDGEIRHAVVRIAPYTFDDGETRTGLTYKDNKITFSWDDDETIGVFPIAPYSGSQAYKHLERSEDDGHVAVFDGAGWKIRPEATYAAYYPYNGSLTSETTFDKIPVSLKRQVQDGYNNLAHIGRNYDYMCATATAPRRGDIEFNFKHITSIVQLEVILPEPGVITNVIIFDKQHEQVFVDSALMNVQTREITPVHKSSMVELEVKNGTEAKANEKVLFYVVMLPRDSRPVDIIVETKDGKCYETSYTPKDMKVGYAYRWSVSPEYAGEHIAVDLGLPSGTKWATMNVGAKSADEYGNFYAWGETLTKDYYDYNHKWGTLKWKDPYGRFAHCTLNVTKYCQEDGLDVLSPEDDAVTQNWGSKWRMPTVEECLELVNECKYSIVYDDNVTSVKGFIVTGKNGNTIFLPFAGWYEPQGHYCEGVWLRLWSSSLNKEKMDSAFWLGNVWIPNDWENPDSWQPDSFGIIDNIRCLGCPVRAVCK
ncbi:MAG: fimbrillin family protein [Bacteroidaceae bacterium]|nr:fimbrillin family protein [Bacteroidaceae bacterium]